MNFKKIEKAIRDILIAVGENPKRPGLRDTPARVARMYEEILSGIGKNAGKEIKIQRAEYDEIVLLKDIPLYSNCEHHMLPFVGKAHVAYIPKDGKVTGLSKLARVVDVLSRRLQVQERLTCEIADTIMNVLQPMGVMVIIECEHFCYDIKTEILTDHGWMRFVDLREEKVAQVNIKTLELTFINPLAKIAYHYEGSMCHYSSDCIDLLVTPDHRMVIQSEWGFYRGKNQWRFISASAIPQRGKYMIPQACSWTGARIANKKLGGCLLEGDDYIRFMGIWLSEGCTYVKSGKHGYMNVVSQKEGKTADRIRSLFNCLPWHWWEGCSSPGIRQFIICNKQLYKDLVIFGKSGDRFIPADIKNSSKEQLKLFLEWYGLGDGHQYKHNPLRWHYVSKSKRLIDDLQEVFVRLGMSGGVQYYGNCARLENRVHKRKYGAGLKGYGMLTPKHRLIVKYEGMVYCVTVPDGAIVVRRNGKVAISGNCMSMRGIQKPGTITKTSAVRGVFRKNKTTRAEALSLIYGN